ncbi:MAG: PAS domain-containing protein [Candidatus Caenarcaniphilales bacterium]|jgi:hypothetical protein|nr:PAS domain-containing protein [Candidatus Caenarcaniphilales bacterium]
MGKIKLFIAKLLGINPEMQVKSLDNNDHNELIAAKDAEINSLKNDLFQYKQIIEVIPVNVMFANLDGQITYVNERSTQTLKAVEKLLPVSINKVKGSNYDIFHS